jgi:hypothetical protein
MRDCWSRVLHSENPELAMKPFSEKPVKLAATVGSIGGHIYTCTGYLCNEASKMSGNLVGLYFLFNLAINYYS